MNAKRARCIFLLVLFSCASCAQESSNEIASENSATNVVADGPRKTDTTSLAKEIEARKIKQYDVGDIFVYVEKHGAIEGSYISMRYADAPVKAKRVLRILETVGADRDFIAGISSRLASNRRLQRESFTLPLIDEDGNAHGFEFTANDEHRLYTINYNFQPAEH